MRYVKLPLPQFYNELNSLFSIYNMYTENGFTYSSEQNLCSVKTCCSVQFSLSLSFAEVSKRMENNTPAVQT